MITLYSGLVVKQPLIESLIPEFEAATGTSVEPTFAPTSVILERIDAGERPDMVLGVAASVHGLADAGILDDGAVSEIAVSAVGFARLPGTAEPIDGSAEAFLDYLLAARAVAYSLSGASGLHFAEMLRSRALLDRVDERAIRFPEGLTAEALIDGRAEVAIQQVSELRSVGGPHIVEPIPHALQSYARFAIGVRPAAPEAANAFAAFMSGRSARTAFEAVGLSAPAAQAGTPRMEG
ncbi:substrate-binding domain-containing protein [Agrococcus sp. DT81.2]|uniref:substrate-binding domain-containing protein n=1 Tax=Agrococcus sp. DT81.2 TaxID=3393414 RepID=UPI003CE5C35A